MINKLKNIFSKEKITKTYKDFSPKDLMTDEFFKKWAKNGDGESSHFWEKWIQQYPEKSKNVAKMKRIINAIDYAEKASMDTKDYVDIYEKVLSHSPLEQETKQVAFKIFWFIKVAALFIITLGSVHIFNLWTTPTSEVAMEEVNEKLLTKECPPGVKTTIRLMDGSVVKLNSGTKLTYPETFSDSVRHVWIEGEAFFKIKEDTIRPFIVHVRDLELKVLGTSFNVNSYNEQNEIALITGKLLVSQLKGGSIQLLPNEMVAAKEGSQLQKKKFDKEKVMAWEKGILYFDNDQQEELFKKLEMWYGVEIIVENGFKIKKGYTGKFDNEYLENVLEGISRTSRFTYRLEKNRVFIKSIK
ncbi:MAG: FecR domain-containing protein [Bacteroidota bacterium]